MTPMACPDGEVLAAFDRGELSAETAEPLAAHVEGCATCQAALGELAHPADPLLGGLRQVKQAADPGATLLTAGPPAAAFISAPPGYELLGPVGRGGMGVVYRARDLRLGREVAVKLLREDHPADSAACARFVAEAQITGQLQHPGIPAVHELGTLPDGRPFLAMKLVKGRTLHELLKERPDPGHERGRFVAVFEHICQAVGYAHAHRVLHRDLKPGNVMVGAFGEVQVMDWGLAKVLAAEVPAAGQDEDEPAETVAAVTAIETPLAADSATRTGAVMGTPAYMAPEQAGGEVRKLGPRSDVFGLGAILCEILTGRPPYAGKDANAVRLQAVRGELADALARLGGCGAEPELVALCQRCLAFRQEDRPADGGAVAQEVARIRQAAEERARRAELDRAAALVREAEQRRRRRQFLVAAGVVAAVLGAGIVGTTTGLIRAERANDRAQKRLRQIEKGNDILTAIFTDLDIREIKPGGEPLEAVLAKRLVKAAEQLEGEAVGDPLVVAALQNRLGQTLVSLGHADEAIPVLEKARATRSAELGADHPDTLESLNELATAYLFARQSAKVLPLLEEAVPLMKAKLGPDHPHTLTGMGSLGMAYADVGQSDKALPLLEETLPLMKAKLGSDHPHTLTCMNMLALSYHVTGQLGKALPLYEEALPRKKAVLGPEHPDTLVTMSDLARLYYDVGRLDKALSLGEETLRLRTARLGPDHPETLVSMGYLAGIYQGAGQRDKALPLYEETLRRTEARLGADHLQTAISMSNLAGAYGAAGQLDKALPLYQEALRRTKAQLGADHPDTLTLMTNLADGYRAAGQLDKALPLLEEALRLRLAKPGPDQLYTFNTVSSLASAYREAKRGDKIVPLFAEYFGRQRQRANPDDPAFAGQLVLAAQMLTACDRYQEAESYARECLAIREKTQPDDWTTFNTRSVLGGALLGQKKYTEAEPLLVTGYEGMKKQTDRIPPPVRGQRLTEALERLVALYEGWGKPDQAAQWRQELAGRKGSDHESKG
jgi:eukaryotic-like serine/threonine-protein kinase